MNEDKATRYQRLKRQASVVSLIASLLFLGGLIITGWSAALRDLAEAAAGRLAPGALHAAATVLCYVVLLAIVNEAIGLPLAFYSGFALERRYGLSNETFAAWLRDQAKSFAIGLLLGGGAAELVYWLIRVHAPRSPVGGYALAP